MHKYKQKKTGQGVCVGALVYVCVCVCTCACVCVGVCGICLFLGSHFVTRLSISRPVHFISFSQSRCGEGGGGGGGGRGVSV